jgi:hypothetical protein
LLSLHAQPAPWLKLVSFGGATCVDLVSVNCATPFPSQIESDIRAIVQVEILTYAPTEFYHCQHCEVVWDSVGFGQRVRAEQRSAGLPAELQAEFTAIADWVASAHERYGNRLQVKVVEGVIKAVRHRARSFPAFIIDGHERIVGFDPERLNAVLERRLLEPQTRV